MEAYENLVYREECYLIQGAIFEVNHELGSGYLESVYQECLELEFAERNIPFCSQKELKLSYKGNELRHTFRPDLICFDKIIVELKAVSEIENYHKAQVLNYLKTTGFGLGLLVNFGAHPKATIHRFAYREHLEQI